MRQIDALELGGTLFIPADHKHLEAVVHAQKFPRLRSVVIDTEDGLDADKLEEALVHIEKVLRELAPTDLLRFIRPRDAVVLKRLLALEHIDRIDGFILPKFGLSNANAFLSALFPNGVGPSVFRFMPSIEGLELFDTSALSALRDLLLPYQQHIIVIRFGAEDMLSQLSLRRDCSVSLYDMVAPSQVIASMITSFKPYGFDIAGPVFACYRNTMAFEQEVRRDLREGLVSKTIIHPDQIASLEHAYRVPEKVLTEVMELLESKKAVFAQDGKMAERATNRSWAERLLRRAELYGTHQ